MVTFATSPFSSFAMKSLKMTCSSNTGGAIVHRFRSSIMNRPITAQNSIFLVLIFKGSLLRWSVASDGYLRDVPGIQPAEEAGALYLRAPNPSLTPTANYLDYCPFLLNILPWRWGSPGQGTDPECSSARCSRSRPPDSTSGSRSAPPRPRPPRTTRTTLTSQTPNVMGLRTIHRRTRTHGPTHSNPRSAE